MKQVDVGVVFFTDVAIVVLKKPAQENSFTFYPSILERLTSGDEVVKLQRRYPLVKYLPYNTYDIIEYKLEGGLKWGNIPQDVSLNKPFGLYSLTFKKEGGRLICKRKFLLKKIWITKKEYPEYKKFIETIINSDKKEVKVDF